MRKVVKRSFHLLFCSSDNHSSLVWTRLKLGATNSILNPHVGGRNSITWAVFAAFQGMNYQEVGIWSIIWTWHKHWNMKLKCPNQCLNCESKLLPLLTSFKIGFILHTRMTVDSDNILYISLLKKHGNWFRIFAT